MDSSEQEVQARSPTKAEKRDWVDFTDDEHNDEDEGVSQGSNEPAQDNRQNRDSRGPGGPGDYNRGPRPPRGRGGPRGGGRGGGRGGRRGDRGEGPPYKKEFISQPKHEMITLVQESNEPVVMLNIFNVDFGVTDDDLREAYPGKYNLSTYGKGKFTLEFDEKDEAIKIIEMGPKNLKGREVCFRFARPRYHNDDWKGNQGYNQNYNNFGGRGGRRDNNGERRGGRGNGGGPNEGGFRPRGDRDRRGGHHKGDRHQGGYNRRDFDESENAEPLGGLTRSSFNRKEDSNPGQPEEKKIIQFFKRDAPEHKKEGEEHKNENLGESTKAIAKPNPFGAAKARDEKLYEQKKEEEKQKSKTDVSIPQRATPPPTEIEPEGRASESNSTNKAQIKLQKPLRSLEQIKLETGESAKV